MKKIMLVVFGLLISTSAFAGYRETTYGNTTYVNGDNGYSGRATTYGNTTYYSDSNGNNGRATTYGNTTYYTNN